MGEIFLKAIIITLALLAFAVPSFILKKLGMLGDGAKLTLGNLLLYVCQPAMIIAAFSVFSDADYELIMQTDKIALLGNFGICAALSLVAMLAVLGVCKLAFIKYKNRSAADIFTYIAIFSNCGFLGVPFVQMFTDGNIFAVMYLMVFNIVFVVLVWTLGVFLITHDVKDISVKKVLLNPTIIASAVAMLLFFVPQINIFMLDGFRELSIVPSALSTMTAPVAMLLIGVALADMPIKSLFTDGGVYIAGVLRLIVAPLITFALAAAFYYMTRTSVGGALESDYIFLAPVIAMAMSPASVSVAMAERYDTQKETAAKAFITNTLFSVLTVPLVIMAVTELWKLIG